VLNLLKLSTVSVGLPMISTSAQDIETWIKSLDERWKALDADEIVFYAIFKYLDALTDAVA
jgi:hypothetical protein